MSSPPATLARRRRAVASAAIVMTLLSANRSSPASKIAIACTGKARFTDNQTGTESRRNYKLPRQVYVLDEAGNRIQLAMEPRQEFEDVCFRDGYINDLSFSPGLVSARSEKAGEFCDFSVSRKTGAGKYFSRAEYGGGRFGQIEFWMKCRPTTIPVFDSSKNLF